MSKRTSEEASPNNEEPRVDNDAPPKKRRLWGGVKIIPFTKHEDEMLVKAVMSYRHTNPTIYQDVMCFRSIRTLMAAKMNISATKLPSAPQIEVRWTMLVAMADGYLPSDHDENDGDDSWDEDEVNMLYSAMTESKKMHDRIDWEYVAETVCPDGLQDFECYLKYEQLKYAKGLAERESNEEGQKYVKWTPAEDEKLIQAVGRCGGGPGQAGFAWRRVAELMIGRNMSQCRTRWVKSLQPAAFGEQLRKTEWSMHEAQFLLELVQRSRDASPNGVVNWLEVADYFCGRRSVAQCRQKYSSIRSKNHYWEKKQKKKK